MKKNAARPILGALAAGGILLSGTMANAAYPDRPVHLVIGLAPGGGTDFFARLVAKKLQDKWGQPVIVENRPGADGSIAADYVAHQKPDGYTLLEVTTSHTIPPEDYKLNYDPIKSFAPISLAGSTPNLLLVNSSVPVNNAKELIALAKSKPGQLNFGSDGTGSPVFLMMAIFMSRAGIKMTNVTYKGGGASMVGLIGNEVQALFGTTVVALPQMQAGKVKALGISTNKRSPSAPDVPTLQEATGIDFNEGPYQAFMAPAGTPPTIITKLHDDYVEALDISEVGDILTKQQGFLIEGTTPAQTKEFLTKDHEKWEGIMKEIRQK